MVKKRQAKRIINKSIFLAFVINTEGHKELMGMWIADNEGTKFWLKVLTELQQRAT
ncbi:transposase [Alteromonas macleodii]